MLIKKISALIVLAIFIIGCSERIAMTRDRYAAIEMGMASVDIEKLYGKPYSIYSKGDGSETYEYIERIRSGQQVLEMRRYYIVISDGKVIGKYLKISTSPSYDTIYSDDPYPNY